jgi:hypothetical protein
VTARAREDRETFRALTVGREVRIVAVQAAASSCGPDNHILYVRGRTCGRADQWPSAERYPAFTSHVGMYRAHVLTGAGEQVVGYRHPTLWAALVTLVLEYDWRAS